jgi:hypothetical protein
MSHEFVWVRDTDTGHHYAVRDDALQPTHSVLKSEDPYAPGGRRVRRPEPKGTTASSSGKSAKSEGK